MILPLTFLGGVFYSVDHAPEPLGGALAREPDLLHRQRGPLRLPRASATSASGSRSAVTAAIAAAAVAWSQYLFTTGKKLKP